MSTFVIVGATGGIGREVARQLASGGHELVLAGRDQARLSALAGELGARSCVCDVLEPDSFKHLAEAAGPAIDGIVYAVGSITLKPLQRLTEADCLLDFRLNALGAASTVQALLPALRKSSLGSIVLFSSVAAQHGFSFHASISMAKGAVEGLTRALAAELAPRIRVNAIAPSLTRTPLAQGLLSKEGAEQALAALHPLHKIGEPEDVASLATYLLSPAAKWMTGQVIGVDGGRAHLSGKG